MVNELAAAHKKLDVMIQNTKAFVRDQLWQRLLALRKEQTPEYPSPGRYAHVPILAALAKMHESSQNLKQEQGMYDEKGEPRPPEDLKIKFIMQSPDPEPAPKKSRSMMPQVEPANKNQNQSQGSCSPRQQEQVQAAAKTETSQSKHQTKK